MADDNDNDNVKPMPMRVARKITFNAITDAVIALDRSAERDELSKTDIINRALQLYDLVREEMAKGQALYLGPPDLQNKRGNTSIPMKELKIF